MNSPLQGPPLWSSGQSSWLQIQRTGFDFRLYQIFWEVVGLERSPLSLVSTTEELLGRKSSGSGPENREYGSWDSSRCPRGTLYLQKLALTSPTSGGRSAGIVHARIKATEFRFFSFRSSTSGQPCSVQCYCCEIQRSENRISRWKEHKPLMKLMA
jgi:hypothetical protein